MPKDAETRSRFPIPLTLLTGFLGAGKTTVLNHILHADHGLRVAVLVNDFGAVNIDSQLVVGVQGETVSLANGCICCTIRDDLLAACIRLIRSDNVPEYIIVETSGVSDPMAVAQTFLIPEISPFIQVDSILTVVDAEQLRDLDDELAVVAQDQIAVADIVILNKVDLVTPEHLETLKQRWLPPRTRVIETTFGKVPLELVLGVGHYAPERLANRALRDIHVHEAGEAHDHDHDHDHDHIDHSLVFSTWNWTSNQPVVFKALQQAVNALPTSIFRAKGVLYLADVPHWRCILQVVGKRARLTLSKNWEEETPYNQLVVIGRYGAVDAEALTALFEACLLSRQSQQDQDEMADEAFDWMRRTQR